jgi:radical SAM protein with 4Fe4S-binding SPASM domain
MKKDSIFPRLIAFEVTQKCPLNCRHCRAAAQKNPIDAELSTEQCEKILASVAEFHKCVIIFTGGEPLERADIYHLIEYAKSLGLKAVLATCGYYINDETTKKLIDAGITAMSLSLDGATRQRHDDFRREPGAFDNVISAAKCVKEAGLRFQINTTVTTENIGEVFAVGKLAESIGAYCFNPFILVPTGRGKEIGDLMVRPEQYEKLLDELAELKRQASMEIRVTCGPQFARLCREKNIRSLMSSISGCMGGRGFGFIGHDGNVQACGFLDIAAGNLLENGYDFKDIWLGSELFNNIRNLAAYKGKCGRCKFIADCGGCRARAYAIKGDYMESDPICDYQPGGTV